jgi:hypothetical protein
MPAKSRRQRKRHYKGQKKGGIAGRPATIAQPAVEQNEPAAIHDVSTPSVSKSAPIKHPYIIAELCTIGILAGIMLIVLVVLTWVLS